LADVPETQRYAEWLLGGSAAAAFTAWLKTRFSCIDALPQLEQRIAEVEKFATSTEADLKTHLKEVVTERNAYIRDMAEMRARQSSYEEKQQAIVDSVKELTKTVAEGFSALTGRIDLVADRRRTPRE
jgi:regulator of replication initiation timing